MRREAGVIDGDLSCIHCGYNLRTLRVDARCPECGKQASDTLATQADVPPLSDDAIRALHESIVLLLITAILSALAFFIPRGVPDMWRLVVAVLPCAFFWVPFWEISRGRVLAELMRFTEAQRWMLRVFVLAPLAIPPVALLQHWVNDWLVLLYIVGAWFMPFPVTIAYCRILHSVAKRLRRRKLEVTAMAATFILIPAIFFQAVSGAGARGPIGRLSSFPLPVISSVNDAIAFLYDPPYPTELLIVRGWNAVAVIFAIGMLVHFMLALRQEMSRRA